MLDEQKRAAYDRYGHAAFEPGAGSDEFWLRPTYADLARKFMHENYPRKSKRLIHYPGNFYHWTGSHYVVVDDDAINSQIYMWLERPTRKARDEVRTALQSMTHVDRDFQAPPWLNRKAPQTPPRLPGKAYPSDDATDYIACRNGLLSISTGQLLPHTSDFLTMNALPCDFDPNAKAPRWEQFLSEVWPDDAASIEALQEWFGYFISRDLSQQKLFMTVGPRRSGKGTIARVLKELLGGEQNVAAPTLASLKDSFGMEGLINKTAAIIGDVRLEGYGNHELVERLLSVSGQDAINVPGKNRTDWPGTLGVRFLIISNNLPTLSDASAAIISRFLVLRTQQSFMGREDTKLTRKLLAALSGILNWSIAGLRRLHTRGYFIQPESSQVDIDELENQASPVLAWGKERCVLDLGRTARSDELAVDYEDWRGENKYSSIPRPHFFRQLRAAFPDIKPGKAGARGEQYRCYRGIGLIATTPRPKSIEEKSTEVIALRSLRPQVEPKGM